MTLTKRPNSGFTLTEILVVLAIMVLLLAVAMPAFNFLTSNRSLEAGQNQVSALLGRARSLALYHGRDVGVLFEPDDASGRASGRLVWATEISNTGTIGLGPVPDQDPQLLQPGTFIRGVAGGEIYPLPALVLFDSLGRLSLANDVPHQYKDQPIKGNVALVLHDRQEYLNKNEGSPITAAPDAAQVTYLKDNGLFLVINRYNGTFFRSE